MKRWLPQFSLKLMLMTITVWAAALGLLVLPSVRARRFIEYLQAGDEPYAANMLSADVPEYSPHRQSLKLANDAMLMPLDFKQLLLGERRVIISGERPMIEGWSPPLTEIGDPTRAEFIVGRISITTGWHGSYVW